MRLIDADALIEKCGNWYVEEGTESGFIGTLKNLLAIQPTVQPEIIRCKDCIYYDAPHVENDGVRYEYTDIPAEAFDELGTGLVTAAYGINVGGRCCRDYKFGYSGDKRVFVPENNYCGRAERRPE